MIPTPTALTDAAALEALLAADGLLDALPWGVLVLDEQRVIRRVNRQAARWGGTVPEALLGQPLAGAGLPAALSDPLLRLLEAPDAATAHEAYLPEPPRWLAISAARQPGGWVLFGQDITDLKQSQADALRLQAELTQRTTDQYLALFNVMDEGFCVLEMEFDAAGEQVLDYRFREVNPAFERQSGLRDVRGKSIRELVPDLEPFWFELYGRVALSGEPTRYERQVTPLGRWFGMHAFRLGPPEARQVGVLFNDITARKQAEAQQAFLLALSDALRPLADPGEVQSTALRLLGEHLRLDRCGYLEVHADDEHATVEREYRVAGIASFVGTYRLDDYGPDLVAAVRRADTLVVDDMAETPDNADLVTATSYAENSIRAFIAKPLVKHGRLVAVLFAHYRTPRHWTPFEVALVEETAERTWDAVERARAEADRAASEAKYRSLFNSIDEGFVVSELLYDEQGRPTDALMLETNPSYDRITRTARAAGRRAREFFPDSESAWFETYGQVVETGEGLRFENHFAPLDSWIEMYVSRVGGAGSRRFATIFNDITARKRQETNLAFLADVSQDLVGLASIEETIASLSEKIGAHFRVAQVHLAAIDEATQTAVVTCEWYAAGPADHPDLRVHRLGDFVTDEFQRAARAGEIIVVRDTRTDPRTDEAAYALIDMRSFVSAPFRRDGQWLALLSICDAVARDWSAGDVDLLGELAARIWTRLERAQAEEALRASEQRLQLAMRAGQQFGWEIDPATGLVTNTGDVRAVLGFELPPAVDGQFALLHPDDVAPTRRAYARALARQAPLATELRLLVPGGNGRFVWIHADGQSFGTPPRLVGTTRNITARKQQAQQQAFLLGFSDALRAETSATSMAYRALGMLSEQLQLDRCYVGIYHLAEDLATFPQQVGNHRIPPLPAEVRLSDFPDALRVAYDRTLRIDDLAQTEGLSDTDRQNLGALGLRALVAATLRRAGTGPQWAIVALSADVRHWTPGEVALLEEATERTWAAMERARAEEALRASEQRQHFLLANLPGAAVFVVDRELRYQLAEGDALREAGHGPADFLGHTVREMVSPDHWPAFEDLLRQALAGHPFAYEHEQAGRIFLTRGVPWVGPAGQIDAVLAVSYDLTDRKAAEEAVRVSEAKYRLLFETMDQGFIVGEVLPAEPGRPADFRWLEANPQVERLTTMPRAALLSGKTVRDVIPQFEDFLYEQYEQVGLTGEPIRVEQYAQALDRWFDVYVYPLDGPASRRIALLFTNITERKQAEEALRLAEGSHRAELEQRVAARTQELHESRDLLHAIAESQSAYVNAFKAIRDERGHIVDLEFIFVNSITTRVDGGRPLVGRRYLDAFPEAENSGLLDAFRRVIETGVGEDQEVFYDDGQLTGWFRNNATPLGDGVLAIGEDITARKQAEQERISTLNLLEQAETVAGLGSWDYDVATGRFVWSDGMYRLFGLPLGQPVEPEIYLDYVIAEDQPRAEQFVRQLRAGPHDVEETLRLRVGGAVKTVRLKFIALRDAQGRPTRTLGVDLDISELTRLGQDNLRLRLTQQRALFEAVQAAQETERRRMAESLHNGIGQMLYATKLRLDRLHTPVLHTSPALVAARDEADQLLGEAIRQTRVLSHELVPVVLEDFGLTAALQDIGNKMSTPRLRLRSQVVLDAAAAPLAPSLQMALYRMAQELAQNIVKHARDATQASLELETTPGWVLLRAEDNGPGFDPHPPQGAGLGLRSIRDRVALLGGQLETGTVPAGGAYVRIRIPLEAG